MKKLIISVFIIFAFGLISTTAMAKSKRRSTQKRPNYSALHFDSIWFSRMSHKQQKAYLTTMERLVRKMLRGGVAHLDDPFVQMFLPFADAAPRINNGFSFEGNNDDSDFDTFLASINVLGTPIDPGCSGSNQVCSPLMGMACSGSNPGQLACSPDSTTTCASRGSIECLHSSLRGCGLDHQGRGSALGTPYCQALHRVYRRGAEGVATTCATGSFASACGAALRQLAAAGVDTGEAPAPATGPEPTGGDCEAMIAELEAARDNRVGAPEDPAGETRNNDFWRNMRGFAQQACGTTVTAADNMMGLCTVGDMAGADGELSDYSPRTYNPGDDEHTSCVQARIEGFRTEHDQAVAAVNADNELSRTGKRNRVTELVAALDRRIREARASECHTSADGQITDARGNVVDQPYNIRNLMSSIAPKIRSNTALSNMEENQLRAATGLTSAQFRSTFCSNREHDDFMTNLRGNLAGGLDAFEVLGTSAESNLYLGHGRAARVMMNRCATRGRPMQTSDYEGCRRTMIHDAQTIRCATTEHPILAVNRSTNRCMLIRGSETRTTATAEEERIDGTTATTIAERQLVLSVRTPGRNSTLPIDSEDAFLNQYQLQQYRCDGETSVENPDVFGPDCWRAAGVRERHDAPEGDDQQIDL